MPNFLPPLSHTSHVSSPNSEAPSHVRLDFHLTFKSHEDTSGRWEIWTDVPIVNAHGELALPGGGWYAIAFSPVSTSSLATLEVDASSSAIALDAPHRDADTSDLTVYRARAVIAPRPGAVFEYTYRRVHPDGGVEWLGGSGSNGVIRILEEGSGIGDEYPEMSKTGHGLLLHTAERVLISICRVHELIVRHALPQVISIPSSTSAQIQLALLSPPLKPRLGPFSSSVSSAGTEETAGSTIGPYTILVRADFEPFDVDQLDEGAEILRVNGGTPDLTLDAILPGAPTFAGQVSRADVAVEPSHERHTVTAFFLGAGRSKHLVVWASASDSVRTLAVKPHLVESHEKPQVILHDQDGLTLLPATTDSILLRLSPGDAAVHVLRTLELDELSMLDQGPIWLAAPSADTVLAGEKSLAESDIADLLEDDATDGDQDEVLSTGRTERTDRTEGVPELDSSETNNTNEQGPQAIGDTEAVSTSPHQPTPGFLSVLFRLIGHLLAGVWDMFFPRSTSSTSNAKSTAADQTAAPVVDTISNADDEADESEAHTPVDERTPLLRSPQIRRAESASTDTMSPTSPPIAKLYDRLPSLDQLASLVSAPQPVKPSLQYGFSVAPPATFLFAPQAEMGSVLERVSFQWRHKGSPWAPAAAKESLVKGGLVRVEVRQGEEQAGGDWEVRVEGK